MILDGSVWHCSILKFYGHNSKKYRVIVPKPTASIGWSKFYIQGTFYIPGTFYISRMAGNKIDNIYICTWITGMMYITKIDTIQHINTMHTDIYILYDMAKALAWQVCDGLCPRIHLLSLMGAQTRPQNPSDWTDDHRCPRRPPNWMHPCAGWMKTRSAFVENQDWLQTFDAVDIHIKQLVQDIWYVNNTHIYIILYIL